MEGLVGDKKEPIQLITNTESTVETSSECLKQFVKVKEKKKLKVPEIV